MSVTCLSVVEETVVFVSIEGMNVVIAILLGASVKGLSVFT